MSKKTGEVRQQGYISVDRDEAVKQNIEALRNMPRPGNVHKEASYWKVEFHKADEKWKELEQELESTRAQLRQVWAEAASLEYALTRARDRARWSALESEMAQADEAKMLDALEKARGALNDLIVFSKAQWPGWQIPPDIAVALAAVEGVLGKAREALVESVETTKKE